MIRVLVTDDQPLIRRAVSGILDQADGVEVVGEADTGTAAIAQTALLHPDVVLMDIRMPELDGIDATASICSDPELAQTRVLILTTFEEDEYVLAALRAGASGFIGKGAEPEEIARAVRAVHAGESLLSPRATRALIEKYVRAPGSPPAHRPSGAPPELDQLTDREREVLVLVGRGLSNTDIATDLFISPHTAKTHVNRIMIKLQAHDRAQLVILAYESGMLRPGGG
ncbi:DNA-binding NarL/FixJ family response regulator [Diaminobutyricimonas aerilata]|uniref:DNA-binding NarL/FixJ family response regulator n=1 Tax=Diaminobutyricimonas aerilata TaxID=1162967 RepID=A0A2M9CG34_9MICO|nr:response regulator transcription factor [Diaminobutyricimonas aerilata]PJJ70873.1 DNA-binding NarL/FixJ family response regulator [Diaminobutyricimonas aerilata]